MRRLVSDRTVLDLVEHVYAAGCDPAEWPTFVQKVHATVPGVAFSTHLGVEGTELSRQSATAGLAEEHVKSYFEHYQHLNPYNALFHTLTPGKVYTASEVVAPDWLERQVFFREWLKPAGGFASGASVVLARDQRRLMRVSFDIPLRLGHLEQPCAQLLERLGPHMTRAFEVNERLQAAVATSQALGSLLDRVEGAAAVLDAGGRVIAMNHAAEAMARAGSLFRLQRNQSLVFRQPAHDQAYRRALAAALDSAFPDAPHAFRVKDASLPSGTVMVLPLRPQTNSMALAAAQPRALIIIRPANGATATPKELLQTLYGLTPAEAVAVVEITAGLSARDAAERLGISQATIRNQLAAAMTKMGVHRQAELVAAVSRLAPRFKLDGSR